MDKELNKESTLEKKEELIENIKYDVYMCDNDSVYVPIDLENIKNKKQSINK